MKNLQKGNVGILLLAIVVLIAGSWYFYQEKGRVLNDDKVLESQELNVVKDSNIKDYFNYKYGFELSYPNDWVVNTTNPNTGVVEKITFTNNGYTLAINVLSKTSDAGGIRNEDDMKNYTYIRDLNGKKVMRLTNPVDGEVSSEDAMYMWPYFFYDNTSKSKLEYPYMYDVSISNNNTSYTFEYVINRKMISQGVNDNQIEVLDNMIKSLRFTN